MKQAIELLTALELCLLNKTHFKHTSKTFNLLQGPTATKTFRR